MEFTIGQLISKKDSLGKLLNCDLKDVKGAYRLTKMARKIGSELSVFEEKKNELVQKYGEKTKDGFSLSFESANWSKYVKDISPILEEKVSLDIVQVTLDMLEGAVLSANDLLVLEEFILDDEVATEKKEELNKSGEK